MTIFNSVLWWASWPKIPLNDITTLSAEDGENSDIILKRTDVWNLVVNWVTANSWTATKLVRKVGSAPSSSSDGTLVTTSTTLNQYQTNGYDDTWLTDGTTYYYKAFSVGSNWLESWSNSVSGVPTSWWKPWANTIGYYPMNNDILNHATTGSTFPNWILNTATFSTTKVHWNNTYSLYCNGSTYAYLPASSKFEFWTNDFTISCWVYSETNSWTYTWIISNYKEAYPRDLKQWWRISDRFNNSTQLNFCWDAWNVWQSDIWVDGATNVSIKYWWHNIVLTRTNGTLKLYLDGNTTPKWTTSSYPSQNIWRNAMLAFWLNIGDWYYSTCYLNDVIFENVWWTAQEVSDYYTLTA